MGGKTCGESAVEFEVIVVGVVAETRVTVDRNDKEVVTHAQCTLHIDELRLAKKMTSHRRMGEVRDKRVLFGTRIVVVGLISIGKSGIGSHIP